MTNHTKTRETERLKLESVNLVTVVDADEQYEIIAGVIVRVRCLRTLRYLRSGRHGKMLCQHVIPTLPTESFDRQIKTIEVEGQQVNLWPPFKLWVIRKQDGGVYQMHPEYCRSFAHKQLRMLEKREAEGGNYAGQN